MKYIRGYNATFPVIGCTTFANDSFYVRNYDLSPELYDGRFVFSHSKESYASVGFSEHIIGRLDGMNEKGLVVGLHLVNQFVREKGLMATTIVRMILDQDRKSTRLNSSHVAISYAVFCLKKKKRRDNGAV